MKPAILFMVLFFNLTIALSQDTYYYRHVYSINKQTEARTHGSSGKGVYVTFTKDGCYESDKDGVNIRGNMFFKYRGKNKNVLIFQRWGKKMFFSNNPNLNELEYYDDKWLFSSDKKRMNRNWGYSSTIDVYERANPEDIELPNQLY